MTASLSLASDFSTVLRGDPLDLARAALVIARLEYPNLTPGPWIDQLDRLGRRAAGRIDALGHLPIRARVGALNRLLFAEERLAGNRLHYDDCRNSCLNAVLDRRLGIPITLALVYMEVARRAGMTVQGVGFPGHFLLRVPEGPATDGPALILDPFDAGAELGESACRALLAGHLGALNLDLPLDPDLLRPCTPRHMLARMLNNLKRTYVELRLFPQARQVTELLLVVDPTLLSELRDRGLLAYHLDDFPSALRDLQAYLRLGPTGSRDDREERAQIREHVKSLHRRVAGWN
jgi:regulator of sirC expression with transglutaminase-like and TPR domain